MTLIPMTHSHFKRVESGSDPDPQSQTRSGSDPVRLESPILVKSRVESVSNPDRVCMSQCVSTNTVNPGIQEAES